MSSLGSNKQLMNTSWWKLLTCTNFNVPNIDIGNLSLPPAYPPRRRTHIPPIWKTTFLPKNNTNWNVITPIMAKTWKTYLTKIYMNITTDDTPPNTFTKNSQLLPRWPSDELAPPQPWSRRTGLLLEEGKFSVLFRMWYGFWCKWCYWLFWLFWNWWILLKHKFWGACFVATVPFLILCKCHDFGVKPSGSP